MLNGADALRFMLTTGISPGSDIRYSDEKVEAARNFANKLWNASRFVIMNLQDEEGNFREEAPWDDTIADKLHDEDKWMVARVNEAAGYTTDVLEKFELGLAGQRIYDIIWNEYCDWYIEMVKGRLYGDDEEDKKVARAVLVNVLKDLLRLLHPFMPFITEEIWGYLPHEKREGEGTTCYLINDQWPTYRKDRTFAEESRNVAMAHEVIRSVRNIRAEVEAAPSKALHAILVVDEENEDHLRAVESHIKKLANVTDITYQIDTAGVGEDALSAVITGAQIYVPLEDLVDLEAEAERLGKEKDKLTAEVARGEKMLSNPGFVNKAPAEKIEQEKAKLADYKEKLAKVEERLAALGK